MQGIEIAKTDLTDDEFLIEPPNHPLILCYSPDEKLLEVDISRIVYNGKVLFCSCGSCTPRVTKETP